MRVVVRTTRFLHGVPLSDRTLLEEFLGGRTVESSVQPLLLLDVNKRAEVPGEICGNIIIVSNILRVDKLALEHGLQNELIEDEWIALQVEVVVRAVAKVESLLEVCMDLLRVKKFGVWNLGALAVPCLEVDRFAIGLEIDILAVSICTLEENKVLLMQGKVQHEAWSEE